MAAQLEAERGPSNRRRSPRRRLRLEVETSAHDGPANAIVHDLSNSGFLLQTLAELAPSEELQMNLPEAGKRSAIVVWRSNQLYGCRFDEPVSSAAISAAILKAAPQTASLLSPETEFLQDEAKPEFSTAAKLRICLGLAVAAWTVPAGCYFLV
jgi:hypothetical protein